MQSQECRLWEITASMKRSNVRIIGIPEGVEKEKGLEEIVEEIVAENFPNLAKKNKHSCPRGREDPSQAQPRQTYATSRHSAIRKY